MSIIKADALSNTSLRTTVKTVRIRSFPGLYFPVFGLNTEKYGVKYRWENLWIRTHFTQWTGFGVSKQVHESISIMLVEQHGIQVDNLENLDEFKPNFLWLLLELC